MTALAHIFTLNVSDMTTIADDAATLLHAAFEKQPPSTTDITPAALTQSLAHFFDILRALEQQENAANTTPIDMDKQDLADHGLRLLNELHTWSTKLQCDEASRRYEQLTIPLAIWAARHQLSITELELLINALSALANNTHEPAQLAAMSDALDEIIEAIAPQLRQDLDRNNPGRPWRILNINHSIIATRSHDPQRMEAVFEQLLFRLPEDAPGFFDEGMQQMSSIDYPDHVRAVMEKYYQKTHRHTLH
jgi:hypothetical protein